MRTKRRHRNVSAVNAQCTSSARTVTTRKQWKRYESEGNGQLERRMIAMELRKNAMIAVRTPWKRHGNAVTSPSS